MSTVRSTSAGRLRLVLGATALFCVVGAGTLMGGIFDNVGYRFHIADVDADPGDAVTITVQGDHEESAQGFTFAATYPAADLSVDRVHVTDTILEAIESDFFETKIDPDTGVLVVGVLVDTNPPFEGALIPNIGFPIDFFHIEATVSEDAIGDLVIRLEDGISSPPVENLYSVNNQAAYLTELSEGTVRLSGAGGQGQGAHFLRGDVNMDLSVDISDPIALLRFAFHGLGRPSCLLAADANDDEDVDISDPIYILEFLFVSGSPPPPPTAKPGLDPTPSTLGCDESVSLSE